jgi:hypothetical protein
MAAPVSATANSTTVVFLPHRSKPILTKLGHGGAVRRRATSRTTTAIVIASAI